MCGIFCQIGIKETLLKDEKVLQRIRNRGPDFFHSIVIELCKDVIGVFFGSVLWMQGKELTKQPIENEFGILLYNGDNYDMSCSTTSDTLIVMDNLSYKCNTEEEIINMIKSFQGPFSVVYYSKTINKLFFARDKIGRNSLLFHKNQNNLIISSVLDRNYDCVEIPANSIYELDLNILKIKCYPWVTKKLAQILPLNEWYNTIKTEQDLPDELFAFNINTQVNDGQQINTTDEIQSFVEHTAACYKNPKAVMEKLLQNDIIIGIVNRITELLKDSVKVRLKTQPNKCKMCLHMSNVCTHSTVGVLFSGGLDCTILAFLADQYLPKEQSIDLINVAFRREEKDSYDVPDRLTGRQSLEELKKLCPLRQWMWKEVNIPREYLENSQKCAIADLIYPRKTVLDESLGSALWFAALGCDANNETSKCRLLLLGSGADELFGGYIRHRNAFRRHGWSGLSKELLLDWNRISFRNLARDNRVICDHGKQPRLPYLDENFTNYVLNLKPWYKCYPANNLGPGLGDKLMLRLVAFNLGLRTVSTFPKRALQFGTRIANKKEKGSDISRSFVKQLKIL